MRDWYFSEDNPLGYASQNKRRQPTITIDESEIPTQ
jgi:hypothetical protein